LKAYAVSAELMMQQHSQIERSLLLPSVLLSTRNIPWY
jgi:hypothetical protein